MVSVITTIALQSKWCSNRIFSLHGFAVSGIDRYREPDCHTSNLVVLFKPIRDV